MADAVINFLVKGQLNLSERIAASAFIVGIDEGTVQDKFSAMKKLIAVEVKESPEVIIKLIKSINEEFCRLIPLMEDHDFGMTSITEESEETADAKKSANYQNSKKNPADTANGAKEFKGSEDSKDNPFQKKGETRPLAKSLRAKGMTQDELAQAADVDKSTISRIKLGVRKPSFELIKKLSDVFGNVQSLFPELA